MGFPCLIVLLVENNSFFGLNWSSRGLIVSILVLQSTSNEGKPCFNLLQASLRVINFSFLFLQGLKGKK